MRDARARDRYEIFLTSVLELPMQIQKYGIPHDAL